MRGERISRKKGVSLEFADYREYTPGDDLRHLDWSILARLNRAAIRTYQDEDDLAVYIVIDTSMSMDFGVPIKFEHARMCAAAMGFIGLTGQDLVRGIPIGSGERPTRALRGRASLRQLEGWLTALRPNGREGCAAGLARFATSLSNRSGLLVCITDGLDPDLPTAIRAVGARGFELALVQVLAQVEIEPNLEGDLRLIDAESGRPVEVTAHAETLRAYKRNLQAHCADLESTTTRAGGRYALTVAGETPSDFLSGTIRRIGLAG